MVLDGNPEGVCFPSIDIDFSVPIRLNLMDNEVTTHKEVHTSTMTLDEAIEHYKNISEKIDCQGCSAEHSQLGEWLTELKQYKIKESNYISNSDDVNCIMVDDSLNVKMCYISHEMDNNSHFVITKFNTMAGEYDQDAFSILECEYSKEPVPSLGEDFVMLRKLPKEGETTQDKKINPIGTIMSNYSIPYVLGDVFFIKIKVYTFIEKWDIGEPSNIRKKIIDQCMIIEQGEK
jgi:hypothetical protein